VTKADITLESNNPETISPVLRHEGAIHYYWIKGTQAQIRNAVRRRMRKFGLRGNPEDLVSAAIPAGTMFEEVDVVLDESRIIINADTAKNQNGPSSREYSRSRMTRTIHLGNDGKPVCHNDYFRLAPADRSRGVDMFRSQVAGMRRLGLDRMETHAAGNGMERHLPDAFNGYYTWPRFGYESELSRYNKSLLPDAFRHVTHVSDLMETREGRAAWQMYGSDLENAVFDLKDGSYSLNTLRIYLLERASKS
jgi:hypothetical protein